MKTIEELKEEFAAMDQRLLQAEKDVKEVMRFRKRLKEISKNMEVLGDFYLAEEWLTDRVTLHENLSDNEYFQSAGEDPIWNVMQDFLQERVKLLKYLAKKL